jgi:hypothetical protein
MCHEEWRQFSSSTIVKEKADMLFNDVLYWGWRFKISYKNSSFTSLQQEVLEAKKRGRREFWFQKQISKLYNIITDVK